MKALIICPERPAMRWLSTPAPLCNLSLFGTELICYWIEHLASIGATDILISASDRPEQVRAVVGDGSRWGVKLEVLPARWEFQPGEARAKFRTASQAKWVDSPNDIIVADRFPGGTQNIFESTEAFFAALKNFLPHAAKGNRIGMREIAPGVWAGLRTQISPTAKLVSPCWLSDEVIVGSNATVGPYAILESRVVVDTGAIVTNSLIAPQTFVGRLSEINDSIAVGACLLNWKYGSHTVVTDPALLCGLNERRPSTLGGGMLRRGAAWLAFVISSPAALPWALSAVFRGQNPFTKKTAVGLAANGKFMSVQYYELTGAPGLWSRWPQLWNVAKGEFTWVGNRPLTSAEAEQLSNDFERLWLTCPIGLVSQADSFGCPPALSDEVKAHSSYYSTQANWRIDLKILSSIVRRLFRALRPSDTTAKQPAKTPANWQQKQLISR